MVTRGIILAAGRGARLNGVAGDDPKCLARVGRMTLIERQVRALREAGVRDLAAVVGCGAARVRRACGPGLTYVENPVYDRTNSLYSLWLARHLLEDGFVVLNADVLLHPRLLVDLLTSPHADALLVSYCGAGQPPLGDEEMKVRVREGRVVDISKEMDPRAADGENVGVVKFGSAGARLLISLMDGLIAGGGERHWAPRAFLEFARRRPLYAISTCDYPWIEIDFPEDYRRAVEEILPGVAWPDEEPGKAEGGMRNAESENHELSTPHSALRTPHSKRVSA